jgi:hypothetical protein
MPPCTRPHPSQAPAPAPHLRPPHTCARLTPAARDAASNGAQIAPHGGRLVDLLVRDPAQRSALVASCAHKQVRAFSRRRPRSTAARSGGAPPWRQPGRLAASAVP